MVELVFGTSNPAKVAQIQGVLGEQIKLSGLTGPKIEVAEDGVTAEENARIKALTYARSLKTAVLSMDNALYLDDLPDKVQPGINVRRINGEDVVSDEVLLGYYATLARLYSGVIMARWHFALAVATPDGRLCECTVIAAPRQLVAKPTTGRQPGYPIESLMIDPETGMYIADMSAEESAAFWRRTIGKKIARFIQTAIVELGL